MKYALIFVGGIGVGLFIADQYAQWKATNSVNGLLSKIPGGSAAAPFVDPIVAGLIG